MTDPEILAATGWKPATLRTYENKGLFSGLLDRRTDGAYRVVGSGRMTFDAFKRRTTQSQYLRDVTHSVHAPLARALVKKASENMVLALEMFNRPSLENRLDAFVLLFCCAWEQFLKATVVESHGEAAIFRAPQPRRHRETISLQDCLDKRPHDDPVRKNLETIKYLRDRATHLLMPEIQAVAARLFQSGIMNFTSEYEAFAGIPFLPASPMGLLTLVGDTSQPTVVRLQGLYGDATGQEVLDLFRKIKEDIDEADDDRFAIGLEYRLVFTKDAGDADIQLSHRETGAAAVIIEKPKDVALTHPLLPEDVLAAVNKALMERFPLAHDLESRLVGRKANKPVFNDYDLQAVLHREAWRRSNNARHHMQKRKSTEWHSYSPAVVEDIVAKIVGDADYISKCRTAYAHHRKSKPRR